MYVCVVKVLYPIFEVKAYKSPKHMNVSCHTNYFYEACLKSILPLARKNISNT